MIYNEKELSTVKPDEASMSTEDRDLTELETYIDAAWQHGENEHPDHEIGDLQAMLREVWELMPDNLRASVLEGDTFVNTYEAGASDGDRSDLETFIEAARQHGEDDEADHEAGDLQDMLREAWDLLPDDQRATAVESDAFRNTLEAGYPGEYDDLDEGDLNPDL